VMFLRLIPYLGSLLRYSRTLNFAVARALEWPRRNFAVAREFRWL
jgi:hypothetical protein